MLINLMWKLHLKSQVYILSMLVYFLCTGFHMWSDAKVRRWVWISPLEVWGQRRGDGSRQEQRCSWSWGHTECTDWNSGCFSLTWRHFDPVFIHFVSSKFVFSACHNLELVVLDSFNRFFLPFSSFMEHKFFENENSNLYTMRIWKFFVMSQIIRFQLKKILYLQFNPSFAYKVWLSWLNKWKVVNSEMCKGAGKKSLHLSYG